MSIILQNIEENSLKNNEEACILREIFNIIEAKKERKEIDNIKNPLLEKYNIKIIKIEKINEFNKQPKNRFKSKLQKILSKKSL